MAEHLEYDGINLTWVDPADGQQATSWRATSGLVDDTGTDRRNSQFQCMSDAGPLPEGSYRLRLTIDNDGTENDPAACRLLPAWDIQSVPRGAVAGECESYWANWGHNRVRLEPEDAKTKNACSPRRSGFYLHDSAKGFTHGCIETSTEFFTRLRAYALKLAKKKGTPSMRLVIAYRGKDVSTYGYTDQPNFIGPIQ